MDWDETFKIIFAALASVGGAGAIILGISKYFGELYAKKYEQKLIEKFQNTLRYSNKQFKLYSILWSSLQNLKISADNLWERASSKNLSNFSKQLRKTKIEIEKASLFIEDNHYLELIKTIKHFGEFQIGKKMLIEYRKETDIDDHIIEQQMIAGNHRVKERYEELILIIKSDLKKQLKGE